MAWSKPHDFQIDSLAEVGNDGLNWEALAPYVSRSDTLSSVRHVF
jgi:hypothetical protein